MSGIVVVSGNPRPGSRTSVPASAVGQALCGASTVVEVGALGAGLLTPDHAATAAAALLAQLLGELGAAVAPALPVVEAELPESAVIAAKYAAAHGG
jgi:hypothetical protein